MFNELIKDILKEAFFKNLDISTDIEFQKRLNLIKNSTQISEEDKKALIDRLNASYLNCKGNIHNTKMLSDASKFIHQYNPVNNNRFITQHELQRIAKLFGINSFKESETKGFIFCVSFKKKKVPNRRYDGNISQIFYAG